MDRIWAPWRIQYILGEKRPEGSCVFCDKHRNEDTAAEMVLEKGENSFSMMNLYPYNSGHAMVAPFRHASCITELEAEEISEIMALAQRIVSAMKNCLHPQGFTLGFNIGRTAGAGIADHLHFHIVPRWTGDSNFMPVLGDTRVFSEHIEATYRRILGSLEALP